MISFHAGVFTVTRSATCSSGRLGRHGGRAWGAFCCSRTLFSPPRVLSSAPQPSSFPWQPLAFKSSLPWRYDSPLPLQIDPQPCVGSIRSSKALSHPTSFPAPVVGGVEECVRWRCSRSTDIRRHKPSLPGAAPYSRQWRRVAYPCGPMQLCRVMKERKLVDIDALRIIGLFRD